MNLILEELNIIFPTIFMLIFIYLLSSFFDVFLLLLLLGGPQLGILIAFFFEEALGLRSPKLILRAELLTIEIGSKLSSRIMFYLILLSFFIYPILMGTIYFSNQNVFYKNFIDSSDVTTLIIRLTLLIFIYLSFPWGIAFQIRQLLSENLDEKTRSFILIENLTGLISTAIYFALAYWAFSPNEKIRSGPFHEAFNNSSLLLTLILFIYFIFFIVIPYIIGSNRAKILRIYYLEKEKCWIRRILKQVDIPRHWIDKSNLRIINKNINHEINIMTQEYKIIDLSHNLEDKMKMVADSICMNIEASPKVEEEKDISFNKNKLNNLKNKMHELRMILESCPLIHISGRRSKVKFDPCQVRKEVPKHKDFYENYIYCLHLDPRIIYLNCLIDFSEQLDKIIDDLSQDKDKRNYSIDFWDNMYKEKLINLIANIDEEIRFKLPLGVSIAFVLTAIVSGIISELSKWVWQMVSGSI